MSRTSLSELYRRLTASAAPTVEADELAAVADGTLAAERRDRVAETLAASAPQAAIAHVLRDLRTDSEALAADVGRVRRDTTHRRHRREERRVTGGRRFGGVARWTAAAAACLVAVLGVWTQRHVQPTAVPAASAQHALVRGDVIFSTRDKIFGGGMDARASTQGRGDDLFHGDFSG